MVVRAICDRCGALVLDESGTLGKRDIARLSAHLLSCEPMLATEDPNAEPPLTEVLRHFEIAIDFT